MKATAFVDARKPFPDLSKKHSPDNSKRGTKLKGLSGSRDSSSGQDTQLKKQVDELKRELAEAQGKIMLKDQTILEMKQRLEQDNYSSAPSAVNENMLIERENAVAKSEEELINRLTFLMEKEATLEQLEEDLLDRERRMNECEV